jgi:transcriptional regulator of arginine metabolism
MARTERQLRIIEIIKNSEVQNQRQLEDILKADGFKATQATISRDIKELGLIKTVSGNRYVYTLPNSVNHENTVSESQRTLFRAVVVSIVYALNNVVIKTTAGAAASVGALIDSLGLDSVLGCVAGDDTIFIITDSAESSPKVVDAIKSVL